MMMILENILIDLSVFGFSFICFLLLYNILIRSDITGEDTNKLEAKIGTILEQQNQLLETAVAEKVSTFSGAAQIEEVSEDKKFVRSIKDVMKAGGISGDITVGSFSFMCICGSVFLTAVIIHFNFLNKLFGIPIGMFVGAFLVYNFLSYLASKKRMEFLRLFPDAIDMMIRGVKAGLNVERIVKLVSMESKAPISDEFKIISQKLDIGVKPERVLIEAAEKIDIEEFRFLVVALVLQMENGGVLAEILQNLSGIVRKRLELQLKMKAMSAEARMSAIVISALPFVFAGIMAVLNPNHLKEFILPGTGQTLLKVALSMFAIGVFFMMKATKIKV
ncbi:MAG: type II secretion system F family protein [Holosporaceae bacterium]|jgi:tight adherence protein B|nr:type II secretion system F family protein [Holosporaceae bacterium]